MHVLRSKATCERDWWSIQCIHSVYTLFTADQQLYRVMITIIWAYRGMFDNFMIPWLAGMHILKTSFVGCIGALMADSGLQEVLRCKRWGKISIAFSASLWLPTEEPLRDIVENTQCYDELVAIHQNKRTTQYTEFIKIKRRLFHLRSLEMFNPRNLTFDTTSMCCLLTVMGANGGSDLANEIRSFLHLVSFSWNLFACLCDQFSYSVLILVYGFCNCGIIYVFPCWYLTPISSIIRIKSHGPSLNTWGTPAGMSPHSDLLSCVNLTLCLRLLRKSITQ